MEKIILLLSSDQKKESIVSEEICSGGHTQEARSCGNVVLLFSTELSSFGDVAEMSPIGFDVKDGIGDIVSVEAEQAQTETTRRKNTIEISSMQVNFRFPTILFITT